MADDVFAQQEALRRREKLLQALQQQGMQTPIQGQYGLGQALAKIAQAYMLKGADTGLRDEQAANNAQYQEQLQGQMGKFLDAYNGEPGIKQFGATPEMPATEDRGDPRAAIAAAMTSQYPEMQTMGKTMLPGLIKQQMTAHDYLQLAGNFDPTSTQQAAAGGGIAALKPKREYFNVDGRVIDKNNPQNIGADYREVFGKPYNVGGDRFQTDSRGKEYQTDNGTKVHVGVSPIITGPKTISEEWAKLAGKTVTEMADKARASVAMMGQLNQLEALTKSGTINGPAANPGIWVGQLLTSMGYQPKPGEMAKLTNSQHFGNVASELWLKTMNEAGGSRGLVKAESDRIANNLPSLVQTPEGRMQIIQFTKAVAQQNIADAQQSAKEYGKALQSGNLEDFTFGLSNAQLPRTEAMPAQGTAGGVMSLDDYLKSKKPGAQ